MSDPNIAAATNVRKDDAATGAFAEQQADTNELNEAPVGEQQIEELPDREAMSLVNANVAAPINLAAALNVLSDNSTAIAVAEQNAPIDQSI